MEWTERVGSTECPVLMGPTGSTEQTEFRVTKDRKVYQEAVDRRVLREYLDLMARQANAPRTAR